MSFDSTDDVQPPEGQGDAGQAVDDSPYASYLERMPEEAREVATEAFKTWDGNYTRHQQEAADYRRSWEPYEQAGVNRYEPEGVAWALQILEASQNNPAAVVEWARAFAEQNGLQLAPEQSPPPDFQYDNGYQDPQAQLNALLEQRLGPMEQRYQQQQEQLQQFEHQQRVHEASQYVESQIAELEQKHGADFNRDMVELFAGKYVESDPLNAIPRGWEDWQKVQAGIEKGALQKKVGAPAPAEGGGVPDVSPDRITSLKDPKLAETARQVLRNARSV